jgi:ABC-type Fe3+/spermidine/putrescine transport system ATPase subunit
MTVSNRLVIMDHGRLIQEGTPQEVYYNPNCIFCASFVGESNLLPARVVGVGQEATLVRVGERTVRARPNPQAREGQAVSLLIRPEVLSLDRQAPNHDNILQGEIIDVTFLGSSIVFRVDTGWDKPLQVQQAGKDDPDLPKRGEKVALGWSSYDTLVLLE